MPKEKLVTSTELLNNCTLTELPETKITNNCACWLLVFNAA